MLFLAIETSCDETAAAVFSDEPTILATTLEAPLIAVNHIEAHIYAARLAAGRDIFPCVGLVVSGGHTALFRCRDALDLELLGSTRDDAAGEAFDKVAQLLGLGFP